MFKFIASASLAVSAVLMTAAPVAVADTAPATRDSVSWLTRADWVTNTLAEAGIKVPANVHIVLTDTGNCGAQASNVGLGGCTTFHADGTMTVAVSPRLAGSVAGNHVLFHEYAHTLGYGECEAEAYAQVYTGRADVWAYPECKG